MIECEERKVLLLVGGNPRRLVPGSLVIAGDNVSWSERCKRRRCPHDDGLCHAARSAYLSPTTVRAAIEAGEL